MRYTHAFFARLLPFSCLLAFSPIAKADIKSDSNEAEDDSIKKNPVSEKVKIDGFVRSMFEAENFKDGDTFHEARLEVKTKRRRGIRGEFEVDFRTKNDDLQVNEALLDKKWDNGMRMKVGYDLKRFGLEYEESRLERQTIERSYIYNQMELFNYNGHETVFVVEKEGDNAEFHDWGVTASFSESQNFSLIGNWQTDLPGGARYGLWVQGGTHKIQDDVIATMAMINSIWKRDSQKAWQAEIVYGVDPNQTEYESVFDDDERVFFAGFNSLYGHYLWNDGEESLMAQVGLTAVAHDQRKLKYNSLGGFLGVRYDLDTLRIAVNAELIGRNSPIDLKKRTYDESNLRLEALFAF